MEAQEKSFRDLQEDERIKRLERQIKLAQIRRPNQRSQLRSSSHMSISGISSIHSDNLPSDFSLSCSSAASSRAGSVIISASNNLRKIVTKNLRTASGGTPSTFEHTLNGRKVDADTAMMPPPPVAVNSHKPRLAINSEPKMQAVNSTPQTTVPQIHGNQTCNTRPLLEMPHSENNIAVERAKAKEILKNNDNSKQYGRVFRNWIVRLNDHGQITIKGRLESGDQARSKPVKRRLTATTVLSVLNHKYHLIGDIHDVREELPEYIRGKFYNGFPTDWENVRQVWQCYVVSGYSLQFRWPRPMADSDDDLRSDITDLTVAMFKNTRSKPISFVVPSSPQETEEKEIERSGRKKVSHSQQQEKLANDSDISSIHSVPKESPVNGAEKIPLNKSCVKIAERIDTPVANNLSTNRADSVNKSIQNNDMQASRPDNFVPRWKIDVIIDNLMNKNCSKEYIEKFITAMNCFNELFTVPPVHNVETLPPDEGVSLNFNSNGQITALSHQINTTTTEKTEPIRNVDSSRTLRNSVQAVINPPKCNSVSLESCGELEEEEKSPSKHYTHFYKQPVISRETNPLRFPSEESIRPRNSVHEKQNLANYSDGINKKKNCCPEVKLGIPKLDFRLKRNEENQNMSTMSRDRIIEKSPRTGKEKRKTVFDSTDSEQEEQLKTQERRNGSVNSTIRVSAAKTRNQKRQPVAVEKMNNHVGNSTSRAFCDSDVSIVDIPAAPGTKPRMSSIEDIRDNLSNPIKRKETLRPDFSFSNSEQNDHSKENFAASGRNAIDQMIIGSSSVVSAAATLRPQIERSSVLLHKVKADIHDSRRNDCTPNKSDKLTKNRHKKSKIETDHRVSELAVSDSEHASLRMSSRGRRILPPLDYWNGERVTLKGRELIYSPGTTHSASLSGNCSMLRNPLKSPNNTALSAPTLTSAVESSNKDVQRIGGILSEISVNRADNDDHTQTADRRLTRGALSSKRKNTQVRSKKNTRNRSEEVNTSSEEETIKLNRRQKRRRIH